MKKINLDLGSKLNPEVLMRKPVKLKHAAPSTLHWRSTTYKIGDGDHFTQPARPGSDHRHLQSYGDRT